MADAISVSGADQRHRQDPHVRDRQARPAVARARSSPSIGDTVVLVTANAAKGVREGIDFFPLTVDVEERMYAAGKIPGSFFRREGRPERPGHPHLPPHRPAAAPVVPRRLPQRDPGRRHRPRRRPGEPARRARHQRRVGGADAVGHPVRRPDRRRAPRVHHDGEWIAAPHLPRGRRVARSRSSSPAVSSTTATSPS